MIIKININIIYKYILHSTNFFNNNLFINEILALFCFGNFKIMWILFCFLFFLLLSILSILIWNIYSCITMQFRNSHISCIINSNDRLIMHICMSHMICTEIIFIELKILKKNIHMKKESKCNTFNSIFWEYFINLLYNFIIFYFTIICSIQYVCIYIYIF